MKEFYILSLKHGPVEGKLLWWGPGSCGYTSNLLQAGRYSQALIEEDALYYDNKKTTIAVPVEEVESVVVIEKFVYSASVKKWKGRK